MSDYALTYSLEFLMSKVWLVTGSGRGLGRDISEAVLSRGDLLLAAARDPAQLAGLVARFGERIKPFTLDVTDPLAAHAAVQAAVDTFGRLDVLVNNAGYGELSPFEQMEDPAFRAQIDTNFYGVVNLTRAAVPVMRKQRSGHILQVSSVGGRIGTPGMSAYQAAKWAVGGFSEVLNQELAPIGIKVCILEPGGMHTGWVARAAQDIPQILPDYIPSVGAVAGMLEEYLGNETGDPAKVADLIVRLGYHDNPPLHLLIGTDAVFYAGQVDDARAAAGAAWRKVSESTDFASTTSPVFPD
jgi:NAD(P)-dependent dehydrogenase (short-subunit alcohol dehydrogenase family)